MKAFVFALVLANLALAAWQLGMFGPGPSAGREPGRVAQQIEAERVRVLSAEEAAAIAKKGRVGRASAGACVELGDFAGEAAARMRARLDALGVGDRTSARAVEGATLYAVFVPAFASRAAAEAAAADLRRKGVTDLQVLGPDSAQNNAISLGVFRDRELAARHLEDLRRRGVANAQMEPRAGAGAAVRLRVERLGESEREAVLQLEREAGVRAGACAPSP